MGHRTVREKERGFERLVELAQNGHYPFLSASDWNEYGRSENRQSLKVRLRNGKKVLNQLLTMELEAQKEFLAGLRPIERTSLIDYFTKTVGNVVLNKLSKLH